VAMLSKDDITRPSYSTVHSCSLQQGCIQSLLLYLTELCETQQSDEAIDQVLSWPTQATLQLRQQLFHKLASDGRLTVARFEKFFASDNMDTVNLHRWRTTLGNNYFRAVDCNSRCWVNVTNLDISCVDIITDDDLSVVVHMFPNLSSLNIYNCELLTSAGVDEVIQADHYRATLTDLDISFLHCDVSTVARLPILTNLVSLRMTRSMPDSLSLYSLSKAVLSSGAEETQNVDQLTLFFPSLKVLDIGRNPCVDNSVIDLLVSWHLLSLTELNLTESSCHSGPFIQLLDSDRRARLCGIEAPPVRLPLERLELSWCENVDLRALELLCQHSHELKVAAFRNTCLNSSCVRMLAENNGNLMELHLARCADLENTAAFAVAANCPQLRLLDVSWAFISDDGIISILVECKYLQVLLVQGCKHLTIDLVNWLLSSHPKNSSQTITTEEAVTPPRVSEGSLTCIDFGWVNMFNKQMAVALSKSKQGLYVVDYYNEVYVDGVVIADFL
jgi:hypothetical protein